MRQFQDSPAGGAREPSSYFLVNDALDLHGLHDVGDELRVDVGVSDLLVEQSSDGALHTHTSVGLKTFNRDRRQEIPERKNCPTYFELRADGLWLEADVKNGNIA